MAAGMIRGDRIDILIDLTMHMQRARPQLFARKPAPIQIAWLAYPGTTGLKTIDYRISDPNLDPPGANDAAYSETTAYLPETFWCYDPISRERVNETCPSDTAGQVTFGCLNTFFKVNDSTLALWARVLANLPSSRLILLAPRGSTRQRVIDRLGVSPERIEFVDRQPRAPYLKTYHRIDLCLDTIPYNGHTTSLDAWWMGVPTITRAGQLAFSRAGVSMCRNLDLTELVASSDDEFVRIACDLANNAPRRRALRRTLRDRMQKSPLMDAPRFARAMETLYRDVWRKWCAG
jgi:predicted O-linked N-acetylglucosamine transferase (SPINDLY family)